MGHFPQHLTNYQRGRQTVYAKPEAAMFIAMEAVMANLVRSCPYKHDDVFHSNLSNFHRIQ